jgi:sulfur-oxidizing protein SoxY
VDNRRRGLLKAAGGLVVLFAAGLLKPIAALAAAWNKEAFAAKTVADALGRLGAEGMEPSSEIEIVAPQIAENGAVVPIEVHSKIPGTTAIMVLVEKNPYPLVAKFDFAEGALPFVKLNAKMGETSDVRIVATAGGRHYTAAREIKVTIGGCGG